MGRYSTSDRVGCGMSVDNDARLSYWSKNIKITAHGGNEIKIRFKYEWQARVF